MHWKLTQVGPWISADILPKQYNSVLIKYNFEHELLEGFVTHDLNFVCWKFNQDGSSYISSVDHPVTYWASLKYSTEGDEV